MSPAQCGYCGRFVGKGNIKVLKSNGMSAPVDYEVMCTDCWLKHYQPRFGPKIWESSSCMKKLRNAGPS